MTAAKADFINGGFEDPYTPSGTVTSDPITGWTLTGYTFSGSTSTVPPTSISGINLVSPTTPGGITDIYDASNPSNPSDYFLRGAAPTPTLVLPGNGLQSAIVNLRSGHAPFAHSGTGLPVGGVPPWTARARQATSVSQQITVQPSDVDPTDGKVHIRYIAAPVLDNPVHAVNQQPFFAIQLNNITTGRTGSNPLFFQWNFANQPGVPWKTLGAGAGTNVGSLTTYQYTDWQAFDISPGNAFIHVGDTIELVTIASGCSQGGHEGHLNVDDVGTAIPSGLWVTATGPASTTPGSNVTYTYTYTNNGSVAVNNVTVVANLPQGTPPNNGAVTPAQNTTYVSNANPTTGSCSGTAPVTCSIGTLQPGQTGTFTVTVAVPGTWATTASATNTSGPVNNGNYPISGDGAPTLLGPLVQTTLVAPSALSNLTADTSGMPTTAVAGTPYTGSFTCANTSTPSASGNAPTASCDITNLPAGLAVSQCTITPSGVVWVQPANIPTGETVTCDVTGTPTTTGTFPATVTTNASNNSNSTGNVANTTITIGSLSTTLSNLIANTSGMPTTAVAGTPYTGSFTCANTSTPSATGDAPTASCDITNLPAGLAVSQCTITPSGVVWVQPANIPTGETVTCDVTGTPTTTGTFPATVTTNASNNSNSTGNVANTTITIGSLSTTLSNLIANTSGMPTTAVAGTPYTGSFTCANTSTPSATGDAPTASCDITSLPAGLVVSQCTITPSGLAWTRPSNIPANQTVTCDVTGTPTTTGTFPATVTTNASNNSNSTGNVANTTITIGGLSTVGDLSNMVAASSLPTSAPVSSPFTGSFTCTNNSSVTATSVHCAVSGLPDGVTLSSCSSPTLNPWLDGSSLPAHQAVTCTVSGTPSNAGSVMATVTTSATNETDTTDNTSTTTINVSPPVPATLRGSSVLNDAIICCGRPLKLNNLPGPGKTLYRITERTGDARCAIRHSRSQTYLKMYGRNGSCTLVGTKNGITTLPLTVHTPPLRGGKRRRR
jgi:hypothetical protein